MKRTLRRRYLHRCGPLALTTVALACGGPSRGGDMSQDSTPRQPVPAEERVCTQEFKLLPVFVRTPEGEPVLDARVEVRRAADGELVRTVERPGPDGGYYVLDDTTPGAVTPGVAFDVTAQKAGRSVTARIVAGADSAGCHVALLEGPRELVLPGG